MIPTALRVPSDEAGHQRGGQPPMLKQSSRSTCTAKTGGPSLFTCISNVASLWPLRRSPCQGLLDPRPPQPFLFARLVT